MTAKTKNTNRANKKATEKKLPESGETNSETTSDNASDVVLETEEINEAQQKQVNEAINQYMEAARSAEDAVAKVVKDMAS